MAQLRAVVDKLQSDVSNGLFPEGYISEQVLTPLTVKEKSGILAGYGLSHLRVEDDLIGGRAPARRVDPIVRKVDNNYLVGSHALEDIVTPDDYDDVYDPFDADADATLGLTSLILTNKEFAISSVMSNTAVITQQKILAGNKQYSDKLNSDPIKDFKDAQDAVVDGCGIPANSVTMSWHVWNALKYNPQILDFYKYTVGGKVTEQELMDVMGVKTCLIGNVPYNKAKEGQTDTLGQIWDNSITFYVRPESAAKRQVAFGYYIRLGSRKVRAVYKYPIMNPPGSEGIIVQDDYTFQITNQNAAFLIKNAV